MDIIALGELLIDFTQDGHSAQGMAEYERNPGGAPANMLVAARNMGCSVGMICKVGNDMHGHFLISVLKEHGVDTSNVVVDDDVFTTLAFVNIDENGERSFSFARKPGADTCLRADELDAELIRSAKLFHFGSLSLTDEPARSATIAAINIARDAGVTVSFDPNYRANLWSDPQMAVEQIKSVMGLVDIIKCSEEEAELITGIADPVEASKVILEGGRKLVLVTLGSDGALLRTKDGYVKADAFKAEAVDTTGAGDSFTGGFCSQFIQSGKSVDELTLEDVASFARVGCAVAALCVGKRGGIPAIPTREEVEALLAK